MNIDLGFSGNALIKAGERYSFNIRLLGNAVNIAPYIIVVSNRDEFEGVVGNNFRS